MATTTEEIIRLLGVIVEEVKNTNATLATLAAAPAPKPAAASATQPNGEGADEVNYFILSDGRVWKNGQGAFYFAKIDGDKSEDRFSIGVRTKLLPNGNWLHKGDVIAVRGRNEVKTYGTETRYQVFADSVRLISSKDGTRQLPYAADGGETEEDVPYDFSSSPLPNANAGSSEEVPF